MKTYRVTIRATVTKTLTVEAENEDDAYEVASDGFSVLCDGDDENYEQDLVDIKESKS